MKDRFLTRTLLKLFLVSLISLAIFTENAQAIAFAVAFPNTATPVLDPFYNDGNSSIFLGVSNRPEVDANMAGYYYDSDPLDGGTNGLLDRNLEWNRANPLVPSPGWLVRFGMRPDSVGSPISTFDPGGPDEIAVPASYLSFKLERQDDLVFENVTLQMFNLDGVGFDTIWAGTGLDGFVTAQIPVTTFSAEKGFTLEWNWDQLNYAGPNPLEMRVYGLIGADEGTFGSGILFGTVIPETSTVLLTVLASGMLLARRRSQAGAEAEFGCRS